MEEVIGRELRGQALEKFVNELPVLDAIVLRLTSGILSDVSIQAERIARIFPRNSYRANRVETLRTSKFSDLESPIGPKFDRAILSLLGQLPEERVRYSYDELVDILDLDIEVIRRCRRDAMRRLRDQLNLHKDEFEL